MVDVYVDKEKRTVAARIQGCRYDAIIKIMKRYPWVNDMFEMAGSLVNIEYVGKSLKLDEALMYDAYTRKAKCHPEDEWDERTGRSLAVKKVIDAHNDALERAVKRWEKKFLRTAP